MRLDAVDGEKRQRILHRRARGRRASGLNHRVLSRGDPPTAALADQDVERDHRVIDVDRLALGIDRPSQLLKPLLRARYPSLPEPRRRIDLALWAVVVEVNMSPSDAISAPGGPADLLGQRQILVPVVRPRGPCSCRVRAPRDHTVHEPSTGPRRMRAWHRAEARSGRSRSAHGSPGRGRHLGQLLDLGHGERLRPLREGRARRQRRSSPARSARGSGAVEFGQAHEEGTP
jgi:hypothetical protein